jgi:2-methylcitrate dehydratase PrpD
MAPLDAGIVDNSMMPNIGIQHLVALMIVDGSVSFASAHDYSRIDDPRVLEVRQRVRLEKSERMADAVRRWRCEVDVELNDGRVLSEEILAVKGSVENPMDRSSENEKAGSLMEPVLGRRTSALLEMLWNIDQLEDVRAIRRLAGEVH